MRLLLFASLLTGLSFSAYAQYPDQPRRPTDDQPIVIRQAPSDSGDVDPLVREENPLKYMKFKERLLFGGGISGLQLGNPTVIGVNPMAGYQATMSTIVALGSNFLYQNINYGGGIRDRLTVISLNPFVRQQLIFLPEQLRVVYAQAEVEQHWGLNFESNFKPAFLIGGGVNLGGLQITALYNPNADDPRSFYRNPLVLRVGGFFTGPRF